MTIGVIALAAIVLMVIGLLLYSVADLEFGGYLAVGGLLLAGGTISAARFWLSRHGGDFR